MIRTMFLLVFACLSISHAKNYNSDYGAFSEHEIEWVTRPFVNSMMFIDMVVPCPNKLIHLDENTKCYLVSMTTKSFDEVNMLVMWSKLHKAWVYQWL
ncbi:MAG: hypothetical protein GKR92_05285 [Gammaproteobacteria bacterium]|nr:MAG: hypothetical protein GKR92_05285 [Gammaproteobacteria bacterium]